MNHKVKLIHDFCNDQICLDNNYSTDDLLVLMKLDDFGLSTTRDAIQNISNDQLEDFYDSMLIACKCSNPMINSIRLNSFIHADLNDIYYVFDVNFGDDKKLYCKCKEIFYNDDKQKYYHVEPYYLNDYYIYTEHGYNNPTLMQCVYIDFQSIIAPVYYQLGNIIPRVYHFENWSESVKAFKLCENNISLFYQLYADKMVSVPPPITMGISNGFV